ncbi:hypothetical protein HYT25_00275 [Candidatus Pacearchaeota archaeon]|nr:hypothetical protein [Candidatus Pacearchaeota archaeon]
MGFALCRFRERTGCNETGSKYYNLFLGNLHVNVPEMWKHYMINHLVQPLSEEREIIMGADLNDVKGSVVGTRGITLPRQILYVEKTDEGYTHQIGTKPDQKFIDKLESILERIEPLQTKSI